MHSLPASDRTRLQDDGQKINLSSNGLEEDGQTTYPLPMSCCVQDMSAKLTDFGAANPNDSARHVCGPVGYFDLTSYFETGMLSSGLFKRFDRYECLWGEYISAPDLAPLQPKKGHSQRPMAMLPERSAIGKLLFYFL